MKRFCKSKIGAFFILSAVFVLHGCLGSDSDLPVTIDELYLTLQDDHVMASDMPMSEHPDIHFPLTETIPHLLCLANPESCKQFFQEAEQAGFDAESFDLLYRALIEASRAIRLSFTTDVTGEEQAAREMIDSMEILAVSGEFTKIGRRGGQYHYAIQKAILLPDCPISSGKCDVFLDVDITFVFPESVPKFNLIPQSNDYRIVLDDLTLQIDRFSASNESGVLEIMNGADDALTTDAMIIDILADDDDVLSKILVAVEGLQVSAHGMFKNDHVSTDGSNQPIKISSHVTGDIGGLSYESNFDTQMMSAMVEAADLNVHYTNERMPVEHPKSNGASSSSGATSSSGAAASSSATSSSGGVGLSTSSGSSSSSNSSSSSGSVDGSNIAKTPNCQSATDQRQRVISVENTSEKYTYRVKNFKNRNFEINETCAKPTKYQKVPIIGAGATILKIADDDPGKRVLSNIQERGANLDQYFFPLYDVFLEVLKASSIAALSDFAKNDEQSAPWARLIQGLTESTGIVVERTDYSKGDSNSKEMVYHFVYEVHQVISLPNCPYTEEQCAVSVNFAMQVKTPNRIRLFTKEDVSKDAQYIYDIDVQNFGVSIFELKLSNSESTLTMDSASPLLDILRGYVRLIEDDSGAFSFASEEIFLNGIQINNANLSIANGPEIRLDMFGTQNNWWTDTSSSGDILTRSIGVERLNTVLQVGN